MTLLISVDAHIVVVVVIVIVGVLCVDNPLMLRTATWRLESTMPTLWFPPRLLTQLALSALLVLFLAPFMLLALLAANRWLSFMLQATWRQPESDTKSQICSEFRMQLLKLYVMSINNISTCFQHYLSSIFIVHTLSDYLHSVVVFLCPSIVNDCGEQGLLYRWPYYLLLTAPLL